MSCASKQTVIKIELDAHADKFVVGDKCLNVPDHNRPVHVYGYDPNMGPKCACIVNTTVAYYQPETGQVVIFLINNVSEIKCLNHHLLCPV